MCCMEVQSLKIARTIIILHCRPIKQRVRAAGRDAQISLWEQMQRERPAGQSQEDHSEIEAGSD